MIDGLRVRGMEIAEYQQLSRLKRVKRWDFAFFGRQVCLLRRLALVVLLARTIEATWLSRSVRRPQDSMINIAVKSNLSCVLSEAIVQMAYARGNCTNG